MGDADVQRARSTSDSNRDAQQYQCCATHDNYNWQNRANHVQLTAYRPCDTINYISFTYVRSKTDVCQLSLPQGTKKTRAQPRPIGCQHNTARILLLSAVLRRRCCWAPAPAAVDRYLLPAGRSAANPPHVAAAVNRWDRRSNRFMSTLLVILCGQCQLKQQNNKKLKTTATAEKKR